MKRHILLDECEKSCGTVVGYTVIDDSGLTIFMLSKVKRYNNRNVAKNLLNLREEKINFVLEGVGGIPLGADILSYFSKFESFLSIKRIEDEDIKLVLCFFNCFFSAI